MGLGGGDEESLEVFLSGDDHMGQPEVEDYSRR